MAYAFVGSLADTAANASATTIALSSLVIGTGEVLRVFVRWASSGGTTVSSISDGTNTYTRLSGPYFTAAGPDAVELWEAKNTTSGTYTLTVTFDGSRSYRGVGVVRYSGLDVGATAQAVYNQQTNAATTTDAVTSTTLTPASQPGMLCGISHEANNRTVSAGTGFTDRGYFTNMSSLYGAKVQVEDIAISSTSAVAATFTVNNAVNRHMTFAAYTLEDTGGAPAGQPTAKRFGGVPGMGGGQRFGGGSTWKRALSGLYLPERKFA